MKTKIKNIANRPLPVPGTKRKIGPGEITQVEMSDELRRKIKNRFFEDLGDGRTSPTKKESPKTEPERFDKEKAKDIGLLKEEPKEEKKEEKKSFSRESYKKKSYGDDDKKLNED
ncbi:MAG: hypothetical protein GY861_17575 [bacterium]|nr:hypothetical protein [bacterium]